MSPESNEGKNRQCAAVNCAKFVRANDEIGLPLTARHKGPFAQPPPGLASILT